MGQVEGMTALNCVAWAGDRALAQLLLEHQAEPYPNGMGESPEEAARNSDQKQLLALLRGPFGGFFKANVVVIEGIYQDFNGTTPTVGLGCVLRLSTFHV